MCFEVTSYRQGCVLIQLVFGSNSKACVVAASCPGQVHRCLQVTVHLLVNGATELCAVITETQRCKRWRLAGVDISLTFILGRCFLPLFTVVQ